MTTDKPSPEKGFLPTTRRTVLSALGAAAANPGNPLDALGNTVPTSLAETRLHVLTVWQATGRLRSNTAAGKQMFSNAFALLKAYAANDGKLTPEMMPPPDPEQDIISRGYMGLDLHVVQDLRELGHHINRGEIALDRSTIYDTLRKLAGRTVNGMFSGLNPDSAIKIEKLFEEKILLSKNLQREVEQALRALKGSPHVTDAIRGLMKDRPDMFHALPGHNQIDFDHALRDLDFKRLFPVPDSKLVEAELSETFTRLTGRMLPHTPPELTSKLKRIIDENPDAPFNQKNELKKWQEEAGKGKLALRSERAHYQAVENVENVHPLPVASVECLVVTAEKSWLLYNLAEKIQYYGLCNLPEEAKNHYKPTAYNHDTKELRIYAPSHQLKEMLRSMEMPAQQRG